MSDRLFDLEEAESLLPHLEHLLQSALENRNRIVEIEREYAALVESILMKGGRVVDVVHFSRRKREKEEESARLRDAVEQIECQGCLLKDLDIGLVDFPCWIEGRPVYLCWKSGEPHIQYWHNTDEGFACRKPIDKKLIQPKRPRPV